MAKGVILPDKINPQFLICTAYLTASKLGYDLVSLNYKELDMQVPKIKKVLDIFEINTSDLLLKDPKFNNYINYIAFLIHDLCNTGLGSYNKENESIRINCDYMDIWRSETWSGVYSIVISELCYAITNDKIFIGNRTCQNCGYSKEGRKNIEICLGSCKDGYCCNHVYRGGSYKTDIGSFRKKDYSMRVTAVDEIRKTKKLKK